MNIYAPLRALAETENLPQTPFFSRIQVNSEAEVYAVDSDRFIADGAETDAQRKSNRMAIFTETARKLLVFGQKTLIISAENDGLFGDAKSAFRKRISVSCFSLSDGRESSSVKACNLGSFSDEEASVNAGNLGLLSLKNPDNEDYSSENARERSETPFISGEEASVNETSAYSHSENARKNTAFIYTEEDYLRLKKVMAENDDVRSIFVIGSSEEVNLAKRLACEFSLPLSVFLTLPDGDSVLSPYFLIRKEGRADLIPCDVPKFVFFDVASPLSEQNMRTGTGFVAKALTALPEAEYLGGDFEPDLLSVIKDCLFTDFTKPTAPNKLLLHASLLKISALKNAENRFLFTPADCLIETLGFYGVNGKAYAYVCSRLIAEVYLGVLSAPDLTLTLPPDPVSQFLRLKRIGASPRLVPSPAKTLDFPFFTAKIDKLVKSLSMFEASCNGGKLPLTGNTLADALLVSATVSPNNSLLREVYSAGFFPCFLQRRK